jgi:hypothetical protein
MSPKDRNPASDREGNQLARNKANNGANQAFAEAARAERRLLRDEARATRQFEKAKTRLSKAEAKLTRAQERFAERQAEYDEAASHLLEAQQLRAAGPLAESDVTAHQTEPSSDEPTKPAEEPDKNQ